MLPLLSPKDRSEYSKSIKAQDTEKTILYSLTLMAVIVLHDDLGELSPINCFGAEELVNFYFLCCCFFNSFIHSVNIFN